MGNVVKLRIRERQAAEASAKMRTLSERIEHDRAIRDAKDDFACLRHKVRIPEEACEI